MYPALAILGALKTLARFKELDSKSFEVYYLIGKLLSMLLGLGFGLLIQFVLY